ncbi:hypothetical protein [Natrinema versiforme]|uniref:DNA primase/polymerase bifunctional N-terminal domain-containing protein n=1 Tax=Natrinema versiforme TaxID=88724 RepID=A0A4P8WJK1_9EURY|nr:hypothetical protein [Natrinema versiforme]QCS43648.1 hypothetical protein FEJ81_15295 [Natrinema versiforme]
MTTNTDDETPDWAAEMSDREPVEAEVLDDVTGEWRDETLLNRARHVFRDVYLEARDRADADRAYVLHDVLDAVCRDRGFNGLTRELRGDAEWLVWTPGSRDAPLYAYTPDLAGDTTAERERFAELLDTVGVGTERFIDVHDGQKGSFDTGNAREYDDPSITGNYGVKGGQGGSDTDRWLVDIDVDDYDDATQNEFVDGLRGNTLSVASAHTETERPGHLYVVVTGDPRDVVRDVLGRDVRNPVASFGEIRIDDQYCVGPGSEIVCGCKKCTSENADSNGYGRYEFASAVPPVVWSKDDFRAFLRSDVKIRAAADQTTDDNDDGTGGTVDTSDTDEIVDFAESVDDTVSDALNYGVPNDRSAADSFIAWALGPWLNFDTDAVESELDDHGTSKWQDRGDSYKRSVLTGVDAREDKMNTDGYDGDVPHWAVVKYAVETGIVDEDDLVEKNSDDRAGSYDALPSKLHYEATLEAIEELGVNHGWEWDEERADTDREYYAVVEEYAPDGTDVFVDDAAFLVACILAREDDAVSGDADVPNRALTPIVGPVDEASDDTVELGREVFHELTESEARERFYSAGNSGGETA